MNISSSTFSNMQQMQQTQRKEPPSTVELANKVMETSDIDGDSLLSIDELDLSEESFASIDEDGDGTLSNSELQNSLSSMLDNMKNQKTSPEQFGQMLSNMGLEVPQPPQGGGMPNTSQMASDIFSSNDINTDGLMNISELQINEDLFSSMDGDGDGSITQEELAQGLTTLFESVENNEMSKDEAGDVLSQLGVPPMPSEGSQVEMQAQNSESSVSQTQGGGEAGGGAAGGGGGGESSEEYEDADINQDGIVSAAEYAAYYGSDDEDMANYTMDLVSTLMDAIKAESEENGNNEDDIDLSKFKQIMSMVNEQTQDSKTSEMLDKFISQL